MTMRTRALFKRRSEDYKPSTVDVVSTQWDALAALRVQLYMEREHNVDLGINRWSSSSIFWLQHFLDSHYCISYLIENSKCKCMTQLE